MKSSSNLIWIDLEMNGLDPKEHTIIEIATIVTDSDLNPLFEGPVIAIHHDESVIEKMDEWNLTHHTQSGLIDRVRKSTVSLEEAEAKTLDFIQNYVKPKESPLCGNSIGQDKRFLVKYMPKVEDYLHYRVIDVSTIKELCSRWYPSFPKFPKKNSHTALEDIQESILELQYFRDAIFIKKPRS
ncbi:MAG: oligoribonuclease [bacterium]|jgi:oligoribonuclease